jgi:hypothetical protein
MQQGSLPQFLSAESVTTAQMRRQAAQVRRRAAWCGMVWRGAECGIPQKCPGFFGVVWLICILRRSAAHAAVFKLESIDCYIGLRKISTWVILLLCTLLLRR